MKAWVLHGIGDLRLEEREEKALLDEEVLVAVKAAGICGSDIPRCYQTGAHTHPLIRPAVLPASISYRSRSPSTEKSTPEWALHIWHFPGN